MADDSDPRRDAIHEAIQANGSKAEDAVLTGWALVSEWMDHEGETEKKLHAELAEVLARPEYGCTSSAFQGNHVSGTVHLHHHPDTIHTRESD